jgi:hypothetical protein
VTWDLQWRFHRTKDSASSISLLFPSVLVAPVRGTSATHWVAAAMSGSLSGRLLAIADADVTLTGSIRGTLGR